MSNTIREFERKRKSLYGSIDYVDQEIIETFFSLYNNGLVIESDLGDEGYLACSNLSSLVDKFGNDFSYYDIIDYPESLTLMENSLKLLKIVTHRTVKRLSEVDFYRIMFEEQEGSYE